MSNIITSQIKIISINYNDLHLDVLLNNSFHRLLSIVKNKKVQISSGLLLSSYISYIYIYPKRNIIVNYIKNKFRNKSHDNNNLYPQLPDITNMTQALMVNSSMTKTSTIDTNNATKDTQIHDNHSDDSGVTEKSSLKHIRSDPSMANSDDYDKVSPTIQQKLHLSEKTAAIGTIDEVNPFYRRVFNYFQSYWS